jgi:hypothetical protein
MARDGSGTYTLPAGNPVVSGTTISSSTHNTTMSDVETALTASLTKNGEAVISGTQDFNGNKLILDADADSSITADTDDLIDIEVAGTDAVKIGWQKVTDTGFVTIDPAAVTADTTESTHRLAVLNTAAITIPSGTTPLATSVYITEPNLTATGTITAAASLYIKAAPTEGGSNYALWVDDGASLFDGDLTVSAGDIATGTAGDGLKLYGASSAQLAMWMDASNLLYINNQNAGGNLQLQTQGTTGIQLNATGDVVMAAGDLTVSAGDVSVGSGYAYAHAFYNDLVVGASTGVHGITVVSGTAGGLSFADTADTTAGYVVYDHTTDALLIKSAATITIYTGATISALLIDASQNVTIPAGDLTMTAGNVIMSTSGKGIDFSATSDGAGMTAELFDDYEEGTFTVTVSDGTNDATMGTNNCTYTKIGHRVFFDLFAATTSLGSVSGSIRLTGFPYNTSSSRFCSVPASGYGTGLNLAAIHTGVGGDFGLNSDYLHLNLWDSTAGHTRMQGSEWSANGTIMLSGSYIV